MQLIIGLGNPGKEYARTRHNAGFLALDELAGGTPFTLQKKFHAEIAVLGEGMDKKILVKPQTYMNESGVSVRALLDFYKITVADVIVIHDDKDIALGTYRLQRDRGAAGHNGIKSIIEHLGTKDFWRLRLGIAPTNRPLGDTADFVLAPFSTEELNELKRATAAGLEELRSLS